ncbi:hypothetical protein GCM10025734_24670 [Kitasatospora paranensis]|uniref:ATP-binding protein n=1 Tax=Kitasatospora paranensis TaxID=258053 RepID=UPI0031ECF235
MPELADTAELLASELVTNALVHTAKGAVFEAVLTPARRLRIEVHDGTARMPGRRAPADHATSGRGLLLVEALADDWGCSCAGTARSPGSSSDRPDPERCETCTNGHGCGRFATRMAPRDCRLAEHTRG